jgi:hypothetical protein
MTRRLFSSISVCVLAASCIEQGVSIHNTVPDVSILSPGEGEEFIQNESIEFIASTHDAETDIENLEVLWSAEDGELEGTATRTEEEVSLVVAEGLAAGKHTVTIKVIDGARASATDEVTFTVLSNALPKISFAAPDKNSNHAFSLPVPVEVNASDKNEEDLSQLTLSWGGSAAGAATAPSQTDGKGTASFALLDLNMGLHTISVTVTDSDGGTGNTFTTFNVIDGDADNDGHIDELYGGDDCDDSDPTTYLNAPELCDGLDNDCDGTADDGLTFITYYEDNDGDGFGTTVSTTECEKPAGYATKDGDCNDKVYDINPDADEECDGIDNDCNKIPDDGLTFITYYEDADGDSFGTTNSQSACEKPTGYAELDGDCDDTDKTINPDADELCDVIDNDCDGHIDVDGDCPCDVENYANLPYMFCTFDETWADARDACYDHPDYHLVTVDDAKENAWIDQVVDSYNTGEWWIGLNDIATEDDFVWEDGSPLNFLNWHTDEPNNLNGDEDCAELNYWTTGTWNDKNCAEARYYICEGE